MKSSWLLCLAVAIILSPLNATGQQRSNIVLIVSDDQGYADISAYEHPAEIKTPHLDRIANQGVRFTSGYASAYVCAPSRAGLLTGRYQQRFGFYSGGDSRIGLPLTEITIASHLKKHGYTTGVFGKWHLGLEKDYHPLNRGFDEFYGFLGHGAHDYFELKADDEHNGMWRNWDRIDDQGYLTDNLGKEAASFIARHKEEPFFCYLPFNAVHWPLQAPPETTAVFKNENPDRNIYLGMLQHMDRAVGTVLDELEKHQLTDNTLVLFMSDNGGSKKVFANNGKLREFKQSTHEGGIRIPFLASWPGKLPEGAVIDTPVIALDFFPTICSAAGIAVPEENELDGKSLLSVVENPAAPHHEFLFWDGDEGRIGVRAGKWKLVVRGNTNGLYDLSNDVGETTDLKEKFPNVYQSLVEHYGQWRQECPPTLREQAAKQKSQTNNTSSGNRPNVLLNDSDDFNRQLAAPLVNTPIR